MLSVWVTSTFIHWVIFLVPNLSLLFSYPHYRFVLINIHLLKYLLVFFPLSSSFPLYPYNKVGLWKLLLEQMSQVNGHDDYVLKAVISPLNALVMCSITTAPTCPQWGGTVLSQLCWHSVFLMETEHVSRVHYHCHRGICSCNQPLQFCKAWMGHTVERSPGALCMVVPRTDSGAG